MEERSYCAQHELIQQERTERYREIATTLEDLEAKITAVDSRSVSRDYFRIVIGIAVVLFGYFFLTLSTIQRDYVHKRDWTEWKIERERRLSEVQSNMEMLINTKEDRHLGIHDNGKDSHK